MALFAALTAGTLHAATLDRVTLTSGFEMDCVHREALPSGRIRLYTSGDNYVEVDAASIRAVTQIEAPVPATAPARQPQQASAAKPEVHDLLQHAGRQHNVDFELLAAVVHAESAGHAHAVSRTGAQGLMQLMPGTARELGVKNAFAPEQNINGGSAYLDQLLTRYHDNLPLALAAYNAGPGAVDKYRGVPPFRETRAYVARVIKEFNRRKIAQRRSTGVAGE
ncbi:MAG: lytic transglycosylase domain-containing protein [Acidobacteria bacterium]|nr:lytic transglycosylase domain-containing protein [Acidobacteriota bacterium]